MERINRVDACDLKSQKNVVSDDEFQRGWNTPEKSQLLFLLAKEKEAKRKV